VITGHRPAMDFKLFSAACDHLLEDQVTMCHSAAQQKQRKATLQKIHIDSTDIDQCFEYMKAGTTAIDLDRWIVALESAEVKAAAAVVLADIRARTDAGVIGKEQSRQNQNKTGDVPLLQQQDVACAPSPEYWTVKFGREVKMFQWFFVERRRWDDPIDVWLKAQEAGKSDCAMGRFFALPMLLTTKGLMRKWREFKNAIDDNSSDICLEQLQQLLRLCHLRPPEAEIKTMFQAADADGSGSIDSVEFISIVKSLQTAGDTTGADEGNYLRACHGPSEALEAVLACTHKAVLSAAGSSSRRQCMFHIELREDEARVCNVAVSFNLLVNLAS
jgi:hypothetical protein